MRRLPAAAAAVLLALAGCLLPAPGGLDAPPPPVPGGVLEIHVIDVGQGDAILLVSPSNRTLLVDAGDRSHGDEVIAYLHALGIPRLDVFVASHGDADHIGGVGNREANVLVAFPPERVHEPGYPKTTLTYETFLRTVEEVGAAYRDARDVRPGGTLAWDADVTVTFLHPARVDPEGAANDQGLVLRVAYGSFSVLLTGDAGRDAEAVILARGLTLASTVLKVGHHGSRSSTTDDWLAAVAPELAVVSVGLDNPYGHPHEEVLDRLRAADVPVRRTDEDGSILIRSDGLTWTVVTDE